MRYALDVDAPVAGEDARAASDAAPVAPPDRSDPAGGGSSGRPPRLASLAGVALFVGIVLGAGVMGADLPPVIPVVVGVFLLAAGLTVLDRPATRRPGGARVRRP